MAVLIVVGAACSSDDDGTGPGMPPPAGAWAWVHPLPQGNTLYALDGKFKSPPLRNDMVSAPYMHDGRMAFSNYIGQSVICAIVFHGFAPWTFMQVDRTGQVLIVLAVWTLQLVVSPIWLRHFRFGPLEWLWRSLSYRQRQPFRV